MRAPCLTLFRVKSASSVIGLSGSTEVNPRLVLRVPTVMPRVLESLFGILRVHESMRTLAKLAIEVENGGAVAVGFCFPGQITIVGEQFTFWLSLADV